jgi:hypothetical protein
MSAGHRMNSVDQDYNQLFLEWTYLQTSCYRTGDLEEFRCPFQSRDPLLAMWPSLLVGRERNVGRGKYGTGDVGKESCSLPVTEA